VQSTRVAAMVLRSSPQLRCSTMDGVTATSSPAVQ
jgi:hypothetical protein